MKIFFNGEISFNNHISLLMTFLCEFTEGITFLSVWISSFHLFRSSSCTNKWKVVFLNNRDFFQIYSAKTFVWCYFVGLQHFSPLQHDTTATPNRQVCLKKPRMKNPGSLDLLHIDNVQIFQCQIPNLLGRLAIYNWEVTVFTFPKNVKEFF